MHIASAPGPWQLVLLRAALASEGIDPKSVRLGIHTYWRNPDFGPFMEEFAWRLGDWNRVILLPKATLYNDNTKQLLVDIRRLFGRMRFYTSWHCRLDERPERVINESFKGTDIYFVEDGVKTYQQTIVKKSESLRFITDARYIARSIRRRVIPCKLDHRLATPGIPAEHLGRLRKAYLTSPLQAAFGPPEFLHNCSISTIDQEKINEATTAAVAGINLASSSNLGARSVVVLGQYLMTDEHRHLELRGYERACRKLLDSGFKVLWREHPRVSNPFGLQLAAMLPSPDFSILDGPPMVPVECLLDADRIAFAAAVSSTTLFNLMSRGIDTYTIADIMPCDYIHKRYDRDAASRVASQLECLDNGIRKHTPAKQSSRR